MEWIIKILSLVVIALIGFTLVSVNLNLMTVFNVIDVDAVDSSFGNTIINRAVIVWQVSVLIALGSLFIKQKWRYILTLLPIYAPSLFALIFALSQR